MFHELKIYLLEITDLSRDAMHIHVGLAIFMLIWLLWRWRGARLIAWLGALIAALGGEWLDHGVVGGTAIAQWQWIEHMKDIFSTMLWPTILATFIGALPYVSHQKRKILKASQHNKKQISDNDDID